MHQSSFDLYSVEGAIIFYSVFLCVCFFFLGRQFCVNEVCHVARFGISAWNSFHEFVFPYPSTPIFFVIQLSFPLSSKIQLCNSACSSPKLMSLCFCICSYLFLVIAKDQTCLYLPGKTLSSELGRMALLNFHCLVALQLTRCLSILPIVCELLQAMTKSYLSFL